MLEHMDETSSVAPVTSAVKEGGGAHAIRSDGGRTAPSWWHRDHPTFTALVGFYTGIAFTILVPSLFGTLVSLIFDQATAERLFPFVLLMLVVPLALVVLPRTRRFGAFMWIGILTTLVVVLGVGALVLWFLVRQGS